MGIEKRGFASMDPEKQRVIAQRGGQQAHVLGRAHQFTPEEAKAAGTLGGQIVALKRGSAYMAELGRKGGKRSGELKRAQTAKSTPISK